MHVLLDGHWRARIVGCFHPAAPRNLVRVLNSILRTKSFNQSTADCCARNLLASQLDFQEQRCAIEEAILSAGKFHQVIFYPKYHCELNHIEHFWCNCKQYARYWCEYSLEALRHLVPLALASVSKETILANYNRCQRKMDLYREDVLYGSQEWKKRTCHQKPYTKGEDR